MSQSHIIAWVDGTQAHISHFNQQTMESLMEAAPISIPNLDIASDIIVYPNQIANVSYYDAIAEALKHADEIEIVGPGMEKLSLVMYLVKHYDEVAAHIVNIKNMN